MKSHNKIMSIPEFYAGQSILVTGGTGLMGKVLIEKILRSCPDVDKIYLLIRPKKGVDIQERWSKLTNIPLFEKLKSENPNALNKVHLISGDMTADNLGLSPEDRQLLKEKVTLVYHVAALIQFTDSMVEAFTENVVGTYLLMELAKSFINLKVFVYMSTAYSNSNLSPEKCVEKLLPACQDWRVIMKMVETHPFEFESLKEKVLDGHPNPYTWSKSLAEQVVNEYRSHFSTIIMRPAIVSSTMDDPITGWIDAANGVSAYSVAVAYGVARILPVDPDYSFDFVPVDYAIKASLIAPWKQQTTLEPKDRGEKPLDVYNCAYMKTTKITNKCLLDNGMAVMEEYPSANTVWVPSVIITNDKLLIKILCWFLQMLPAAAADLYLLMKGKKTKALRITRKLVNAWRLTENLRAINIEFPNEQFLNLTSSIKDEDIPAFAYRTQLGNEEEKKQVIRDQTIGFRKYFMKEDLSEEAIKRNRDRINRIKTTHKIITSTFYLLASWWAFSYCSGWILDLM